jgi:hypothetical protein
MYNLIITILKSDEMKNDDTRTPMNNESLDRFQHSNVLGRNTSPPYR